MGNGYEGTNNLPAAYNLILLGGNYEK